MVILPSRGIPRHCLQIVGRDSSVGMATRYGLHGPGIEPRWGARLSAPDQPWGPPRLLYNGYRVFTEGKATGAWRWQPTIPSAKVKERVELYVYSISGPSWPVIGWPSCVEKSRSSQPSSKEHQVTVDQWDNALCAQNCRPSVRPWSSISDWTGCRIFIKFSIGSSAKQIFRSIISKNRFSNALLLHGSKLNYIYIMLWSCRIFWK